MKKFRILPIVLALLLLVTACGKKEEKKPETDKQEATQTQKHDGFMNNLTGEYTLTDEAQTKLRPVAMSINNEAPARQVQTGLNKADIVYETYIEGGATRLLALYKDISKAAEIGTVRSARYYFADLASSNDALYVHAGIDEFYCTPHVRAKGVDNINMLLGNYYGYANRQKNGKALEHTLYTSGESIAKMISDYGIRSTVNDSHIGNWQKFNEKAKELPGGKCTNLSVKFSGYQKSDFVYDAENNYYVKQNHSDYKTGEAVITDNIVVLFTSVGLKPDNLHVDLALSSGEGYYFSKGTFQRINWTKGDTFDTFKFTDDNGKELAYNPGSSWVCITNKTLQSSLVIGE